MIDASFSKNGRDASISGAFQYDTGQRLRMHGLPSPDELLTKDEHLTGGMVTVEVQYSFMGDEKTESRPAEWDVDNEVWVAAIPDAYLTRYADVHLYVYVSYGQDENSMRAKTVYEAVFRPISRPAPGGDVSPNQKDEWQGFKDEINLKLAEAGTAISDANAATESAAIAANAANTAAGKANDAAKETSDALDVYVTMVDSMQVAANRIGAYEEPTVNIEDVTEGDRKHKLITFGIPQSVVTVNKKTADDSGNITLTSEDVGANIKIFYAELPANASWSGYSDSPFSECELPAVGILAEDTPIVDIDFSKLEGFTEDAVNGVLDSWSKAVRIDTKKDRIVISCLSDVCDAPLPLRIMCVR